MVQASPRIFPVFPSLVSRSFKKQSIFPSSLQLHSPAPLPLEPSLPVLSSSVYLLPLFSSQSISPSSLQYLVSFLFITIFTSSLLIAVFQLHLPHLPRHLSFSFKSRAFLQFSAARILSCPSSPSFLSFAYVFFRLLMVSLGQRKRGPDPLLDEDQGKSLHLKQPCHCHG
jgi:hypothetical protein